MRFEMLVSKPGFAYSFHGDVYNLPAVEAGVEEMLAAMKEGLEANGYNVNTTIKIETRFSL